MARPADRFVPDSLEPARENLAIDSEKLRQLYSTMLELRLRDDKPVGGSGKRTHRLQFNEACEVSCTIDLRPEDIIVPLAKQKLALPGSLRILSDSSLMRLSLATGAAFAQKADKTEAAVVLAFCEGSELAASTEALLFALDHHLPIIFVQVDAEQQPRKKPRRKYSGLDPSFPAIPVDRSDAVAVYRVAYEALARARRATGPTLIQCVKCYSTQNGKNNQHCTDPVAYMERYLQSKNLWSPDLSRSR